MQLPSPQPPRLLPPPSPRGGWEREAQEGGRESGGREKGVRTMEEEGAIVVERGEKVAAGVRERVE